MGRVQMSTEEKTGRRARDRKKKNWRKKSFETTKSHSRPAVSRMSTSILLLAGLLFMVTGCSPAAPPGSVGRQDPEVKIRVVCSSGDIRWKSGMDFKNAKELLDFCQKLNCPISDIMKQRECTLAETSLEDIYAKMDHALSIMRESASSPIQEPKKSIGGLIGGEARLADLHRARGAAICGSVLSRAITYSMAVLETNTSMGLIVAAPTAGSSGIVPGLLLALQEEYSIPDSRVIDALFNAGAIGYLAMRNATVAGAVGGCQAEVGVASAMAASAAVELMGGTAKQCLNAASSVLMNLLGLVCDPLGGLVECPCQGRNAAGAAVALTAAELALSGIRQLIPFDEMLAAMYRVGRQLSPDLRETALGGCAATPTGNALGCRACPCSP